MTVALRSAPANLLLAFAGLALAVALLLDLAATRRESDADRKGPAVTSSAGAPDGAAGIEAFRAFVERPPFAPSRRPASQSAPAIGATAPALPNLELVGIVAAGEDVFALVRQPGGRVQRLAVGQSIGGWQLDSIERDRIGLTHEGSRAVVPLMRRAPVQPMPVSEPWLGSPQPQPAAGK